MGFLISIFKLSKICFCTLAIHSAYRERAKLLCKDLESLPFIVLTDNPDDFSGLPVEAILHAPTGPMAIDYLNLSLKTGKHNGAAAYHDKRFALIAALKNHQSAIFLDADSRLSSIPSINEMPPGFATTPFVRKSISDHLASCGSWRKDTFEELAILLTGDTLILNQAKWCHETCISVTKDGREDNFFRIWDLAARFFQERKVFSGEGGVLGLAAEMAGWQIDYDSLTQVFKSIQHESGGPKKI